jgi:hypothetical protein
LSPTNENQLENYDKPKSVKMYLEQNAGGRHTIFNGDAHGNYDTPNIHYCINGQNRLMSEDVKQDCTCHRVMSWADNWMPCKRGNGIENTGIAIQQLIPSKNAPQRNVAQEPAKCKLNDFSHTSQASINYNNGTIDKNGLYALVDPTKKQPKRLNDEQSSSSSLLSPPTIPMKPRVQSHTPNANYANLDFEKSLEIYENSREVLKRVANNESTSTQLTNEICTENKENSFLVMDMHEKSKAFPGYIPMHPINLQQKLIEDQKQQLKLQQEMQEKIAEEETIKRKMLVLRLLERKSHSNPDLSRPCENIVVKGVNEKLLRKSFSVDSFRIFECETPTVIEDSPPTTSSSSSMRPYQQNKTGIKSSNETQKPCEHAKVVSVRHSESSPKQQNRDSSSSNDSGVSTASTIMPKHYNDFETPLINQIKKRRQLNQNKSCVHSSLIRRSKSFDPFGDLSFQFANGSRKPPANGGNGMSHQNKFTSLGAIMTSHIDSNSTSSGTSDMSDYLDFETSSHSSSDVDAIR